MYLAVLSSSREHGRFGRDVQIQTRGHHIPDYVFLPEERGGAQISVYRSTSIAAPVVGVILARSCQFRTKRVPK